MKVQLRMAFVDEEGVSYERLLSEISEGQIIKGKMRFPLKVASFSVFIEAINEEGKAPPKENGRENT